MTVHRRIKEERERLGLSQPALGQIVGVVKQTVIQWEKGASAPDAVELVAFGEAGADVLYILTGQRTPLSVAETPAGYQVEALKPDEAALLDNYRHSSPEARAALKATSDALAQHDCDSKTKRSK